MAKNNARLELTWIGKENRPKLEPRILIEERKGTERKGRVASIEPMGSRETGQGCLFAGLAGGSERLEALGGGRERRLTM